MFSRIPLSPTPEITKTTHFRMTLNLGESSSVLLKSKSAQQWPSSTDFSVQFSQLWSNLSRNLSTLGQEGRNGAGGSAGDVVLGPKYNCSTGQRRDAPPPQVRRSEKARPRVHVRGCQEQPRYHVPHPRRWVGRVMTYVCMRGALLSRMWHVSSRVTCCRRS